MADITTRRGERGQERREGDEAEQDADEAGLHFCFTPFSCVEVVDSTLGGVGACVVRVRDARSVRALTLVRVELGDWGAIVPALAEQPTGTVTLLFTDIEAPRAS